MCRVFKVSRSGYYNWLKAIPSARSIENEEIKQAIRQEYNQSKKRYGSPKITIKLKEKGIIVSRVRVARMMKVMGLKSIVTKKYKVKTTDSNHCYRICDNHLNREFSTDAPSKVWVSDITYITTDQGWLYLTIIMDLFDRKIIGWSMSNNMTAADTVIRAWDMAILNRKPKPNLIMHSDRGVQYACNEFKSILANSNVIQSMSRKGNCWDNAVAESFFKTLKAEMVYFNQFQNHSQAKNAIFEFIEIWYNRDRIHSAIDYMTPQQYYDNYFYNVA